MSYELNQGQFWTLYRNLPNEKKDFLFSDKLSAAIEQFCKDNSIEDLHSFSAIIYELLVGASSSEETMGKIKKEFGRNIGNIKKIEKDILLMIDFSPSLDPSPTQDNKSPKKIMCEVKKDNNDSYREPTI